MARTTTNTTRTANSTRSSQVSDSQAKGISFGRKAGAYKKPEELIGQRFTIKSASVKPSPWTRGKEIVVFKLMLENDTVVYEMTGSTYMLNQIEAVNEDDFIDRDFTVQEAPELSETSLSSKTPLLLQEWDEYWELAHGDRAKKNRDRVARDKGKSAYNPADEEEDEIESDEIDADESDSDSGEDEDDDEIETYTKSQFLNASPKVKRQMLAMVEAGLATMIAEKPAKKAASPITKSAPAKSSKPAPKSTPAKPLKKATQRGEVIEFGEGESKGKGRNPTAVNEALDAGHTVYFSRKTRRFLDEAKSGPVLAIQKSK
jgi:hypothetical protein